MARTIFIAASRTRSLGAWYGGMHFQHLEFNRTGMSNTVSSVEKDNLVVVFNV